MISNGISVVQVNPYAVKQSKEIEDNSQLKDDRKDPKLIANLVKDGNYGMPYLPEKVYADMRRLSMIQGSAYRRQDKKYQSSSQEIKNLFSRIHGRIWKNRWSIYFGSTESISYPIGYHSTGSRRH